MARANGARMMEAASLVRRLGVISKAAVAEAIMTDGNIRTGYKAIDNAIKAGYLIQGRFLTGNDRRLQLAALTWEPRH